MRKRFVMRWRSCSSVATSKGAPLLMTALGRAAIIKLSAAGGKFTYCRLSIVHKCPMFTVYFSFIFFLFGCGTSWCLIFPLKYPRLSNRFSPTAACRSGDTVERVMGREPKVFVIHLPNLVVSGEKAFHSHKPTGNGDLSDGLPKSEPFGFVASTMSSSSRTALKCAFCL